MKNKKKHICIFIICAVVCIFLCIILYQRETNKEDTSTKQLASYNSIRYDSVGGVLNLTIRKADVDSLDTEQLQFFLDNMSIITDVESETRDSKTYNMYFVNDKDTQNAYLYINGIKQEMEISLDITDKLYVYKNSRYEFGLSAVSGYLKGDFDDDEIEVEILYQDGTTNSIYSSLKPTENELPVIRFSNFKGINASFFWIDDIHLNQIEAVVVNGETLAKSKEVAK
ncbi:hypothetical protein ADH76_18550 [Enterocloster clostridioformis]|uniref:hypothetical protein n=3 Tax=Enterocloster clostridioformis TaxID=1531 RepID=UPI00080C535F|nr:hypothetical protein [Enterocloster clostridioformis]ANU47792.1 hypothetical protein A4V08_20255 [Lachnoclostridium sp. YL32]NDO30558.1 hypothetical protein [Enterocloster clostridioformis]OXE66022.1 hypothetical protein ADH76_18550 [Enterocloster clostridioformis]QQR03304.1 hypothetical protein I5Q83_14545 [Enterocloster clostridioformis]